MDNSCVSEVIYYISPPSGGSVELGRSSSPPFSINWNTNNGAYPNGGPYGLGCQTITRQQQQSSVAVINVTVNNTFLTEQGRKTDEPGLQWRSELDVRDANGQLVFDGAEAHFVGPRGSGTLRVGVGVHRLEATIVDAAGKPGTWTFWFGRSLAPGSLAVVAGKVSVITGDTVAVRLDGKPGERVVIKFETR
jgi:hypothetical protein